MSRASGSSFDWTVEEQRDIGDIMPMQLATNLKIALLELMRDKVFVEKDRSDVKRLFIMSCWAMGLEVYCQKVHDFLEGHDLLDPSHDEEECTLEEMCEHVFKEGVGVQKQPQPIPIPVPVKEPKKKAKKIEPKYPNIGWSDDD